MKLLLAFLVIHTCFISDGAFGQTDSTQNPYNRKRNAIYGGANLVVGVGGILLLNEVWYKDYPKSDFHYYNDSRSWLQMDKVGHAYTAYQLCRAEYAGARWAGRSNRNSALLSATFVWTGQFTVEMLDGFSTEWGFSFSDLAANTAGIGLFLGQQLAFKEQRVYLKYGYKSSPYAELRPNTLGSNFPEKLLKDYNAQSYWLSFHPNVSVNNFDLPKWLQLSVGYSADAKLKGDENSYMINNFTYRAHREWALSLDVDWSKLPVKKPWLKKGLGVLNAVKIPFPAVYWRNGVCYVGML